MKNLLMLPALLLSSAALAAPKISAQSIIVNPVQTDVKVRVWTDKDPSGQNTPDYRVGERIRLYTSVDQDAYVYLFDIDAKGTVTQILPNRFASGENFLKSGVVKQFPAEGDQYTFDIAAPYGLNKVLAVASKTPLNLDQITQFSNGNFATAKVQGQQNLAQALSIVVNPIPQNSWTSDTAFYNVVDNRATQTGTIFVGTDAPGATVFLNDRQIGAANGSFTGIQPGNYRLRVSAPGYADYTSTITLRAGATLNVNVQLAQTRATLNIRSNVDGATVFVNGRSVGSVRGGGLNVTLDRGSYEIVVIAQGYRASVSRVDVNGNGTVNANLTRL